MKKLLLALPMLTLFNLVHAADIILECRFDDLYASFDTENNMVMAYDDGRLLESKGNGIKLGYSYYTVEQDLPPERDQRFYIDVELKKEISKNTFKAIFWKQELAMQQSCWDGCDNVSWSWEVEYQIQGVCRFGESYAN